MFIALGVCGFRERTGGLYYRNRTCRRRRRLRWNNPSVCHSSSLLDGILALFCRFQGGFVAHSFSGTASGVVSNPGSHHVKISLQQRMGCLEDLPIHLCRKQTLLFVPASSHCPTFEFFLFEFLGFLCPQSLGCLLEITLF